MTVKRINGLETQIFLPNTRKTMTLYKYILEMIAIKVKFEFDDVTCNVNK